MKIGIRKIDKSLTLRITILWLCFLISSDIISQNTNKESLSHAISLTENLGQIVDIHNMPRPDVLFASRRNNFHFFLKKNGISYLLKEESNMSDKLTDSLFANFHQVDMTFLNYNIDYKINKKGGSRDFVNYYYAHCENGVTNVREYDEVVYIDLYNNIDFNFYGNKKRGLKYDIIVHPFGNPKNIKFSWNGATKIKKDNNGNLVIKTTINEIEETIPLAFQIIEGDTIIIDVEYILNKDAENNQWIVSFDIMDYNNQYDLIIDPWVTNYGGADNDIGNAIVTDKDENVYFGGETGSPSGISTPGSFKVAVSPGDGFISKFNKKGVRLWATYYGGISGDRIQSLALDLNGNIYAGGITSSPNGISSGGFQNTQTISGGSDVFLAKFNSSGARIWATYYGGTGLEGNCSVATDQLNNVYLGGYTESTAGISFNGFQNSYGGGASDGFLVKFSPSGSRLWATYYGASDFDYANDICVDKFNNTYLCGLTRSTSNISSGGHQNTYGGGADDGFLVKFNPNGSRQWATYYGGFNRDFATRVTADNNGNIYLAGETASTSSISFNGYQNSRGGGIYTGFLAKFNNSGTRQWSTYYGGNGEHLNSCIVDELTNNVLIAGITHGNSITTTSCAHQQNYKPNSTSFNEASFIAQFTPNGMLHCSTFFGDTNRVLIRAIASSKCFIYSTGNSKNQVIATPGAHQVNTVGPFNHQEAFLTQMYKFTCGDSESKINTSLNISNNTSCDSCNGSIIINVSPSSSPCSIISTYYNYKWSNGIVNLNKTNSDTLFNLCNGSYWVEVTGDCGQVDTFFFTVSSPDALVANFEIDSLCLNEAFTFVNNSQNTNSSSIYKWSFGDGSFSSLSNPIHTYNNPGSFQVKLAVLNSINCSDSIIKTVNVKDCLETIYFPNSFTPNNDGINDEFFFKGTGVDQTNFLLMIFNKWGELIYKTSEFNPWDGKYKEVLSKEDIYVWKVRYKFLGNSTIVEKTGHVLLLK